jgi:hypothetical protein
MGRALLSIAPWLIMAGLAIYAAVDILNTDDDRVRGLPKPVWLLIILLIPIIGPLVWIFAGKERIKRGTSSFDRPTRVVAPDDDPTFLSQLDREIDREERLRKLEEQLRQQQEQSDEESDESKS